VKGPNEAMKLDRRAIIAVVVGVAFAIPLPVIVAYNASTCGDASTIAVLYDTSVPVVVINSPVLGNASGTVVTPAGTGATTFGIGSARNGSVIGYFAFENWTVYSHKAVGLFSLSCGATSYSATASSPTGSSINSVPIGGGPDGWALNFTNDSGEPSYTGENGTVHSPIYYYNQFYRPNDNLSTCGAGPATITVVSSSFVIGIGLSVGGSWHIVPVTVDLETTYTYNFPANAGTWQIDNLSAPGGPGGGWAFSYNGPC
jgi:hypothetical protein